MTESLDLIISDVETWLNAADTPLVLGICGAQGSGKSTLAQALSERLEAAGRKVALLSLDDLYLSRRARAELAARVSPLFNTRGVPGTHDVALGEHILSALERGEAVRLPRFDKATDEPLPQSEWPQVSAPDVIIFEGWCVGARPQSDDELIEPVNSLEAERDGAGVWRGAVNVALQGSYAALFGHIDRLIFLAAPDFVIVRDWRIQQEHALRRRLKLEGRVGARVMSDAEVGGFIQYYQRLTEHILRTMPAYADRTLWLDPFRRVMRHAQH